MSRVGNRVLQIPEGVEVNINNSLVTIKGKLGTLSREFSSFISIEKVENTLLTKRTSEEKILNNYTELQIHYYKVC